MYMPVLRVAPLLAFVFFFSGFAGLIYQVGWQRLLTLYYGVGPISTTIIVSVYMLGLGAGYLLGGALIERVSKRLIFYFAIELSLGGFGLASLPIIDFLGRHTAGSGYALSFLYIFLFLCIPTTLMGMTLPALMKIFNRYTADFLRSIGFLYFINTIGAAIGALFAAYVIITFFGLDTAIYTAAAINTSLAFIILWAGSLKNQPAPAEAPAAATHEAGTRLGRIAWLLVFVSGFLAIGYEIVWFRVIGILVKDSPYAFSSILAVYLAGVAVGSFYIRKYRGRGDRNLYFGLQILLSVSVCATFLGYFYLTAYSPFSALTRLSFESQAHPPVIYPGIDGVEELLEGLYLTLDVFFWPMVFVFVPTMIMGASLPLISSLAVSDPGREGGTVGTIYFFNTLGNLLGGIVTGFILLPWLGAELTVCLFVCAGFMYILFMDKTAGRPLPLYRRIVLACCAIIVAFLLFPRDGRLYGVMHSDPFGGAETYFSEGLDSVVVTYNKGERVRNFINGHGHGYRPGLFFYAESLEALKYARRADHVLIIGFGAGSIVEAVQKAADVGRITIVELCPTSIENLEKIPLYRRMLSDPRIRLVMDDGRRYLNTTRDKHDLVLADPMRVTTAYSNNIHSLEFFALVDKRLNPGGVFMLGGLSRQGIIGKTLSMVFPSVRAYDSFFLASGSALDHIDKRYDEALKAFPKDTQDGIRGWTRYLGDQEYIAAKTARAPVNLDLKPRTEYYLKPSPADLDK
jgi:predicted membrane-bound spermidine synthase